MSFFQILLDSLANLVGFCITMFALLVRYRMKKPIIRWFLRFLVCLLLVYLSYFLTQLIDISRYTVTEAAFSVLTRVFVLLYSTSLFLLAVSYHALLANSSAGRMSLAYILVLGFLYLIRAPADALGLNNGMGADFWAPWKAVSDLYLVLMGTASGVVSLFYFPRLRKGPLRTFFISFFILIVMEIVVEVLILLTPISFWERMGLSPYFPGMSVMITVIYLVAFRFLLSAYRTSEEEPAVAYDDYGFSDREREVLALILSGMPNKAIADALFISLATVKTHVHRILEKTDCPTRASLIVFMKSGKTGGMANQS